MCLLIMRSTNPFELIRLWLWVGILNIVRRNRLCCSINIVRGLTERHLSEIRHGKKTEMTVEVRTRNNTKSRTLSKCVTFCVTLITAKYKMEERTMKKVDNTGVRQTARIRPDWNKSTASKKHSIFITSRTPFLQFILTYLVKCSLSKNASTYKHYVLITEELSQCLLYIHQIPTLTRFVIHYYIFAQISVSTMLCTMQAQSNFI